MADISVSVHRLYQAARRLYSYAYHTHACPREKSASEACTCGYEKARDLFLEEMLRVRKRYAIVEERLDELIG